jgi:hypothetical protein
MELLMDEDELAFMSMLLELCYWWSSRVGEDKWGARGVGRGNTMDGVKLSFLELCVWT